MISTAAPLGYIQRTNNTPYVDAIQEHRARVAFEEETRQEQRRAAQAEQSALSSAPQIRVRAWEKLHGLRLPSSATHPILTVIAAQTNLTLAEVRAEQLVRKAKRG